MTGRRRRRKRKRRKRRERRSKRRRRSERLAEPPGEKDEKGSQERSPSRSPARYKIPLWKQRLNDEERAKLVDKGDGIDKKDVFEILEGLQATCMICS